VSAAAAKRITVRDCRVASASRADNTLELEVGPESPWHELLPDHQVVEIVDVQPDGRADSR
jgi:hypothetical protein